MTELEEKKRVSFRISIPEYVRLEQAAARKGVSPSVLMKIATAEKIAEILEDDEDQQ